MLEKGMPTVIYCQQTAFWGFVMTDRNNSFFYISNGELFLFDGEKEHTVPSGVAEKYVAHVKDRIRKNEWKESGSGAVFMGTVNPETVESAVASISSKVCCVGFSDDRLIYSLNIDDVCGIYSKRTFRDTDEGIVLSDREYRYSDFDISREGDICVSAAFAGESHIGVKRRDDADCRIVTEGNSFEIYPVWSKHKKNVIFFSGAGLSGSDDDRSAEVGEASDRLPFFDMQYGTPAAARERSAFALCSLDIGTGEITELMSDVAYDFVKPQATADGSIWYIKKPFRPGGSGRSFGGCLLDILRAPIRLLGALVGFFNIFTIRYSGKNLTSAGGTKTKKRSEDRICIDGNIISASKELRTNEANGEKYPGYIPRTFELHRITPENNDVTVKKGVIAYRVTENGVLYSNGTSVVIIKGDGSEELVAKIKDVTFIA